MHAFAGFLMLIVFGLFRASFPAEKPHLVVVVSLDQFRYDYLPRFSPYFGNGGFNLFLKQGANFVNCHYLHSVNKTGPGHAVIMSGTYANTNGIITNNWFDVESSRQMYCVQDEASPIVGAKKNEPRSPKNFIGSTVGDQLKDSNAGQSKVISVSNKDRSAILMGGKLADAAYWMIDSLFVSSTYYMADLPAWVKKFNASGKVTAYFGKLWERARPEADYARQGPDDVAAEEDDAGLGRTFPHRVDGGAETITAAFIDAFETTPFSSEVLAEFAMQALVQEKLGQRGVTDILCIGFSANDRIGHAFGPGSHEVMDITIRTDRLLEKLFAFIDEKVGLRNCAIVLTADHGVAPMPEALRAQNANASAGRIDKKIFREAAEKALTEKFGSPQSAKEWILAHQDAYLYLNPAALREKGVEAAAAEQVVKNALQRLPAIHSVYTHTQLQSAQVDGDHGKKALHSFHPMRTGNIFYQLRPFYFDRKFGSTHGEPWNYDGHVPMLWYSPGIKPGTYYQQVSVADIAPTLAAMLQIEFPAASQGRVLYELFE